MAWQLLYTSAPRLLDAGRTGFGTVARHRAVTGLLASSVERFSQFARLAGHDPKRVVYCHRVVIVGANKYHVLSCLRDAGSDYTGRTNHLAHHVIAEAREIAPLMAAGVTPVDVLKGMDWRTEWTEGARFLEPAEEIQLSLIRPQRPRAWEKLTGSQEYARLPSSPEAQRAGCYLIAPPTVNILDLLGEALTEVSDQAWSTTFTTTLEPNDEVGDFRWIVLPASSPLRGVTEGSPRIVLDLTAPANLPAPPPRRVVTAPKIPKLPTPVPSDPLRPGASSRPEGPVSLPAPILAPVELPMHGRLRAAVPAGATLAGKKAILWPVTAVAVIFLFLLVYQLGRNQGVSVSTTSIPEEAGAASVAPFNEQDKAMLKEINISKLPTDQVKHNELIKAWEEWRKSRDGIDQISKKQYSKSSEINDDLGLFDAEAKAWDNLKRVDTDVKRAEAIRTKIEDSFYDRQKSAIEFCKNAKEATDEEEKLWLRIFSYHENKKELFSESKSSDSFGPALKSWVNSKGNEKELVDKNLETKTNTPEWLKKKLAGLKGRTAQQVKYEPLMGQNVMTYEWKNSQHDVYILIIDTDTDIKIGRDGPLESALKSVKHKLPDKSSENDNIMRVGPLDAGDGSNMSVALLGQSRGYGPLKASGEQEIIKVKNSSLESIPRKFRYKPSKGKPEQLIKYEDDGIRIRMIAQPKPCEIFIIPTKKLFDGTSIGILGMLEGHTPNLILTEQPNSSPENGIHYIVNEKQLFPCDCEVYPIPLLSSLSFVSGGGVNIKIVNNRISMQSDPNLRFKREELKKIESGIQNPENLPYNYLVAVDSKIKEYNKAINNLNEELENARKIRIENGVKEPSSIEKSKEKDIKDKTGYKDELLIKPLKDAEKYKTKLISEINNIERAWEESKLKNGNYELRAKFGSHEISVGQVKVKVEGAE